MVRVSCVNQVLDKDEVGVWYHLSDKHVHDCLGSVVTEGVPVQVLPVDE